MRLLPYGPRVTRAHDSLDPFHGLPTDRRANVDIGSVWEERTEEKSEVYSLRARVYVTGEFISSEGLQKGYF